MTGQLIYCVKKIMAVRFLFGVAQIQSERERIRLFSKLFTLIVGLLFLIIITYYVQMLDAFVKYSTCIEYLIYVIMSIQTKDRHIQIFNKFLHGIDNLPDASKMYKQMNILLIFLMAAIISSDLYFYIAFCYELPQVCWIQEPVGVLTIDVIWLICDICRLDFVFIFVLLYCRVKLLKKSLETELDVVPSSVNIYVKKYTTLVNSLKHVDNPLQVLVRMHELKCYVLNIPKEDQTIDIYAIFDLKHTNVYFNYNCGF